MKKLNLSKIDEIKEKHLEYCSKLRKVQDLTLNERKALFIDSPFTEYMECKPEFKEDPFKNIDLEEEYITFRKFKKNEWNGVNLIKMLNINVCPYCGMSYFSTIKKVRNGNVISEATLDHYLPKSKNRMLALNLYNLVPSCKNCNSSFKTVLTNSIINPYFSSVEENIKFRMNYFNTDGMLDIYNIAQGSLSTITDNHIEELSLKDRYNYFKSIALSIYKKKLAWNKTYITQLSNFKKINLSKEEIKKMLLKQDLFNMNEPFIKLKTDIWEQLS